MFVVQVLIEAALKPKQWGGNSPFADVTNQIQTLLPQVLEGTGIILSPDSFVSQPYSFTAFYSSAWNYVRELPEVKRWYTDNGVPMPARD